MATINLYKLTCDVRKLDKTLDNPLTKEINIRTDIDIYNPTMLLQDFDIAYNYMVWDNRYYFINSAYYDANKVWKLQCRMDILMTYKTEILQLSGIVTSGVYPYSNDATIPYDPEMLMDKIVFPHKRFEKGLNQYVLMGSGMYYEE